MYQEPQYMVLITQQMLNILVSNQEEEQSSIESLFASRISEYKEEFVSTLLTEPKDITIPSTSDFLSLTTELKSLIKNRKELQNEYDIRMKEKADLIELPKKLQEIQRILISTSKYKAQCEIDINLKHTEYLENMQNYIQSIMTAFDEKVLQIQRNITIHDKKIYDIQSVISSFVQEVKKDRGVSVIDSNSCSICLTNHVNRVLVPCGHTFCDECIANKQTMRCPTCRGTAHQIIKLYL